MLIDQSIIDAASTALKGATLDTKKLHETEIAGWFFNLRDGPQFWLGTPPQPGMQPLYFDPAREGQEPVAWREAGGRMITQDRSMYRADIEWKPLYLAR